MLTIAPRQYAAITQRQTDDYIVKLRNLLCEHPLVGQAAASRPIEWYRFAVDRAAHHRIVEELDVAEFTAQLLYRGDAILDDPDAAAMLNHPENPAWVRIRHFARHEVLIDSGDS